MTDDPKPEIQYLTPPAGDARVGPFGFLIVAKDFLDAANVLATRYNDRSWVVPFLYCRAIELALKAFLLARGRQVGFVKKFGHDLNLLLIEAYAHGLDVVAATTPEERASVIGWNNQYDEKELEYFTMSPDLGPPSIANTTDLGSVALRLTKDIERGCKEAINGPYKPF
jgi:hypothetical protein